MEEERSWVHQDILERFKILDLEIEGLGFRVGRIGVSNKADSSDPIGLQE